MRASRKAGRVDEAHAAFYAKLREMRRERRPDGDEEKGE